jgi:SNF2 family DNA or RNA helicase
LPPVLIHNTDDDVLELNLAGCRGSEFRDALAKAQDVPGRRFDYDRKLWIFQAEPAVAERVIMTIEPQHSKELAEWVRDARTSASEELTTPLPEDADLELSWANQRMPWQPEEINGEPFNGLFPYQRAAVDLMVEQKRVILADDMGLGKTIQALATVEEYILRNTLADKVTAPHGPRLIVSPASVKGGWVREINRFLEPDTPHQIIDAGTPARRATQLESIIKDEGWAIANWEQLRVKKEKVKLPRGGTKTVKRMKEPLFGSTPWLAVIADEVHRAKNRKSQQTQGLWLCQGEIMIGASGTPIMNSPDELWAILHWLFPKEYTSYWRFYEQYVEYWEGHFGKIITGVKNPDALRFELKDRVIRRTARWARAATGQKDTSKRRISYPVDLNPGQKRLYKDAEKAMWLEIEQEAGAGDTAAAEFLKAAEEGAPLTRLVMMPNGAARMVRLLQIIESPALLGGADDSAILDDFMEKFEDSRPEPWVVFCAYKDTCRLLAQRLQAKGATVGIYNGDVKAADRTALEDDFQAGKLDAVVGTIAAMKEGITLTRSHLMYFTSRSFVPDVNEQCEAREDRTGQQATVMVYIPEAVGTVYTGNVRPANRRKEKIVRTVLIKDSIEEVSA